MSLAQDESGEMDFWYIAQEFYGETWDQPALMNKLNYVDYYLNYTQIVDLYDDKYNLSPRSHYGF